MTASKFEIGQYFDAGVAVGATHLLVVCDTFDYEDYPVYVGVQDMDSWYYNDGNVKDLLTKFNGPNMQRVHEVYDLRKDKNEQLNASRVWNVDE